MDSSGGVSVIEPVDSNVSSEAEEAAAGTLDLADFFFFSFLAGFEDEREDEVVKDDTVALADDTVVDKALADVVEGRSVVIL